MNKNVIFSIIAIIVLVFASGYLIYYESFISHNDSLKKGYSFESNISANESNNRQINDNDTEEIMDNKNSSNSYQISNQKTISSKSDIIRESNKILNNNRDFFGKNAVVNNVKYDGNGIWYVDFIDSKTGKKVGTTYIDDRTGKMVDAM